MPLVQTLRATGIVWCEINSVSPTPPFSTKKENSTANPSINPTAKKLRFLVPSALRAPAAGYLQR